MTGYMLLRCEFTPIQQDNMTYLDSNTGETKLHCARQAHGNLP